ncbi:MAG: hypothetical protein AAGB35_07330 [Pseudomonadota bacterium]
MNFFRALLKGTFLFIFFTFVNNVHAVVVDFENTGIMSIQNTYFDSNFNDTSLTTLNNVAFYLDGSIVAGGANGIYFSEGVLLQNPSQVQETVLQNLTGGSILYGTGESPSTNVGHNPASNPDYVPTNEIIIDIDTLTDVTSVGGILINGLNTDNEADLADYQVAFFSDTLLLETLFFNNLASSSMPGSANFFYDSGDVAITQVIITGVPFDFGSPQNNGATEWDFLIDNISFNESATLVPLPAALPLFLTALFGVGYFASKRQ